MKFPGLTPINPDVDIASNFIGAGNTDSLTQPADTFLVASDRGGNAGGLWFVHRGSEGVLKIGAVGDGNEGSLAYSGSTLQFTSAAVGGTTVTIINLQ